MENLFSSFLCHEHLSECTWLFHAGYFFPPKKTAIKLKAGNEKSSVVNLKETNTTKLENEPESSKYQDGEKINNKSYS